MKLSGFAAAAALALAPMAAGAVTTTLKNYSPEAANTADIYAANFGAATPNDASWDGPAPTVTPPPASDPGSYVSPWINTPLADDVAPDRDFFAVGGVGGAGGSTSPRSLLFSPSARTSLNLLWGSVDTYNRMEFYSGGGLVDTVTGDDIASLISADLGAAITADAQGNYEYTALLNFAFTAGEFDEIKFWSEAPDDITDKAAFEFATVVPLPAGALLIGTAFLGAGFVSRRRKSAS